MSIRRISVLLAKELTYDSKSFFFIFSIVTPLGFTLIVNLSFSSLFSGKPKLGIIDQGDSQIVESLINMESINLKQYSSEIELKDAVATGTQDLGIVLPVNFESMIKKGESTKLTAYVWGESLLKNRVMAGSALLYQIRHLSGKNAPVEITPVALGQDKNIPLKERLLPLMVLLAVFMGGFSIPATSLVDEKLKRTIGAIITTPATQSDVFVSKGLMGVIVSVVMGISILLLNQVFSAQFGLIVLILFLGAVMASCLGLMLGAFMKDTASLYSAQKGFVLILYGPGLINIIPQIPDWTGKFFPTYYVINPIMEITRQGGSWSTVKQDVFILMGILAVFFVMVGIIAHKTRQQAG